jgi:hypothetical protein
MGTTRRILLACVLAACGTGCIAVPGRQEKCPWPPGSVSAPADPEAIAAADAEQDACS